PAGGSASPRELKIVWPSLLQPGSASPTTSALGGVQLGPPSVICVRSVPSGRILSSRALKQPPGSWPTPNRIQSSLDHAGSPQILSSSEPDGPLSRCTCEPSRFMT